MKIYVLTSGQFDDYTIEGIFDNKELAEKYKELLGSELIDRYDWDDTNDIEEYELNPKYLDQNEDG